MQSKVAPLVRETFLEVVNRSVGTPIFQTLWAEVDGVRTDVTRQGELSCAFFVSALLAAFGWLDHVHATVAGTEKVLPNHGWSLVDSPAPGDLLVWESQVVERGESHAHIGFYLGDDQAVSNSSTTRVPEKHHWTYEGTRQVRAIYRRQW